MPTPAEQLLLKFGVDLTAVRAAGVQIKDVIDGLNRASRVAAEQARTSVKLQKGELDQLRMSAQASVALAKTAIAEEQKKTVAIRAQAEEIRKQAIQRKLEIEAARASTAAEQTKRAATVAETAEVQKQIAMRRAETAELQRQMAVIRRQRLEERATRPTPSSGLLGGLATAVAGGLFGGGLLGGVAGGLLAGAGAIAVITATTNAVERLIARLRELTVEAGNYVKLRDQFQKLARGVGQDAQGMMDLLREATQGEVGDIELMNAATAALKKNIDPKLFVEAAGAVVDLAEAAGRDGTEGLRALTRATLIGERGFRALSQVLGIPIEQFRTELPEGLSASQKAILGITGNLRFLIDRAKELGHTPLTVEDAMKRLHVANERLQLGFAIGLNLGLRPFLEQLSELAKWMNTLVPLVERMGQRIGIVFSGLAAVATHDLARAFQAFAQWKMMSAGIVPGAPAMRPFPERPDFAAMKREAGLRLKAEQEAAALRLQFRESDIARQKQLDEIAYAEGERSLDEHLQRERGLLMEGLAVRLDQLRLERDVKLRQLREAKDQEFQQMEAALGQRLESEQGNAEQLGRVVAAENQARQQKEREFGLQSSAINSEFQAKRLKAEQETQNQLTDLEVKGIRTRRELRQLEMQDAIADAKRSAEARIDALRRAQRLEQELKQDQEEAERRRLRRGEVQPETFAVGAMERAQRQAETQLRTARGIFEEQRRQLESQIGEIYQLMEEAPQRDPKVLRPLAQKLLDLQEQLRRAEEDFRDTSEKAVRDYENAATKIVDESVDERIRANEREFDSRRRSLELQLRMQKELGPGRGAEAAQRQILREIVQSLDEEIARWRQLLEDRSIGVEKEREINGIIQERILDQSEYNRQLREMRDLLTPLGGLLGEIGKGIQEIFTSEFARDLSREIQIAARAIEQAKRRAEAIRGIPARDPAIVRLEREAGALFDKVKTATAPVAQSFDVLYRATIQATEGLRIFRARLAGETEEGLPRFEAEGVGRMPETDTRGGQRQQERRGTPLLWPFTAEGRQKLKDNFLEFIGAIGAAVGALTDFVGSVASAQSTLSGILGGGLTGAGAGFAIGSMFGASGGPIGAAIGAAIGGILGGVVGHKNAAVRRNIDMFKREFNDIMDRFQDNADNLHVAAGELRTLLADVQRAQAQSKKGRGQYQEAIDDISRQLRDLERQQEKVIGDLHRQLELLRAPKELREAFQTIVQIQEQYEKFSGAARTMDELGQAQEFLARSLEEYALTLEDRLTEDMEKAINDAIALDDLLERQNDLLIARQDVLKRLDEQTYAALTRGVPSRQPTRAMTVGGEIVRLREQAEKELETIDKQKAQLEREIHAASYRVDAERRMFEMATTRVDLELQLVKIKNAQTDREMAALQSLRETIPMLRDLIGGNVTLDALARVLGTVPRAVNPLANQGRSGRNILDTIAVAAYEERASMGFAEYRGQNIA